MYDVYCKVKDSSQRIAVHTEHPIPRWLAEQDDWLKMGTVSHLDDDLDTQITNLGYASFVEESRLSSLLPAKVIEHLPGRTTSLISAALVATAVAAAVLVLARHRSERSMMSRARRARQNWW